MKSEEITIPETEPMSPSPRRAWIEIVELDESGKIKEVALPTEGVD